MSFKIAIVGKVASLPISYIRSVQLGKRSYIDSLSGPVQKIEPCILTVAVLPRFPPETEKGLLAVYSYSFLTPLFTSKVVTIYTTTSQGKTYQLYIFHLEIVGNISKAICCMF